MLHKCSIWLVAEVFFDDPLRRFSVREICRLSKLSHTSVGLYLHEFLSKEIIQPHQEKKGKRTFVTYSAIRENDTFKFYKRTHILERIHTSGLIPYLNKQYMPDVIILFGSSTRGEDIAESDIDFYLQCSEREIDLLSYERLLKRKIQLHFNADFRKYPKELRNNIINGIKLSGYLNGV